MLRVAERLVNSRRWGCQAQPAAGFSNNLVGMDSAWLVPVSLAVGFLFGVGVAAVVVLASNRGRLAVDVANAGVPDGVDQVIEALDSAGVVLDASNNVVRASPVATALGIVAHDALAHQQLVDLVDRVRHDGEPITEQFTLQRGPFGDTSLHLSVRVARIGARHVLLIAHDQTEALRLEEVRRDFVANISHELKTPIGAVGLLAEALLSASDDAERVREFADRLRAESQRLGRLTQEIIELSRLQAADMVEKAELLEVDELVAAAIDQSRVAAEAHGIRLVSGGTEGLRVFGDESMLVMAIQNLIANAIQYSPAGSRVGIGVSAADDIVEIAVTDQGVGIPEDELDRVFERFFRTDPARSRHTGGSGLGLSIVKHVVQNHGGDVRVWSRPEHGSTFTIRLQQAGETAAPEEAEQ